MLKKFFLGVILLGICLTGLFGSNSYARQKNNQDNFTNLKESSNSNLVFYKKNCPYCEGAEKEILEYSRKTTIPTFFIDTRSNNGKTLVKKYNVRYASTIIKIREGKAEKYIYAEKQGGAYRAKQDVIKKVFGGENR
ncbi:thioredoxin [Ligilactobacillus faecis]|uniref:thioredoxin n=1 Tax=Ligilactobacillus faecis TaxID=762833 RepID=UPI0024692455|nr:thioredoxin [Ligilactobacillus faecis]WGN89587.1 thioredoxin [Ligilactobacillus faecis]